jgi:predicted Zn-ribbon and HTH transcriptional regulator
MWEQERLKGCLEIKTKCSRKKDETGNLLGIRPVSCRRVGWAFISKD